MGDQSTLGSTEHTVAAQHHEQPIRAVELLISVPA